MKRVIGITLGSTYLFAVAYLAANLLQGYKVNAMNMIVSVATMLISVLIICLLFEAPPGRRGLPIRAVFFAFFIAVSSLAKDAIRGKEPRMVEALVEAIIIVILISALQFWKDWRGTVKMSR